MWYFVVGISGGICDMYKFAFAKIYIQLTVMPLHLIYWLLNDTHPIIINNNISHT